MTSDSPGQDRVGLELSFSSEVLVLLGLGDDHVERHDMQPRPHRLVAGHLGQVVGDEQRQV